LLAILACWCSGSCVRPAAAQPKSAPSAKECPVQFHSEVIQIFIEEDSVAVEGSYILVSHNPKLSRIRMFYPYPEDSLLGGARTSILEWRPHRGYWLSAKFEEAPDGRGARWDIPLASVDTFEVRTVYRQAMHTNYARYIVTTTESWGRPLVHARFEIYLPQGAETPEFSFPFELSTDCPEPCYVYEAENFLPERDITVTWGP
jgi:hypothetical protein